MSLNQLSLSLQFGTFDGVAAHRAVLPRHKVTRWIRHALATDAFVLDAQPVVSVKDGHVDHHELLLRMIDDDGTLVRPNGFLHIAERFGLMPSIDEWVIRQAIGLVSERAAGPRPLTVAVNVGRESVQDAKLLSTVLRALGESPHAGESSHGRPTSSTTIRHRNGSAPLEAAAFPDVGGTSSSGRKPFSSWMPKFQQARSRCIAAV